MSDGLYAAPSCVTTQTTVTVTATSAADSTKAASAAVTLNPSASPTPPAQPTTITVPLEVIGTIGTTATVSFNIPSGTNLSGLSLAMTIHGLRSQTQASLQLNNSGWQPISENNVTLLGQASSFGGIGGGFHTLQMTMPLSTGAIQTGTNTLTFRFNQTDGRVSGFRVLALNVQNSAGTSLISSSNFVDDDPNTWHPPSTNPSDVVAGKQLFQQGSLTVPTTSGPAPIQAHCADCHTQDGRDLKYFNYSNLSISNRAVFHGMTPQQGNQIASYVRSLNLPNPGRPWNPPYQPGPGLDSAPVEQWSAGAGVTAVLDSDADLLNELFPTGSQAGFFSPNGNLNVRGTKIPLQLPDWNSWLPTTHPIDAWSDFASSKIYSRYETIRSDLQSSTYAASLGDMRAWGGDYQTFIISKTNPSTIPVSTWTPQYASNAYSTAQWAMVKSWDQP
jgi:hypothetical protein